MEKLKLHVVLKAARQKAGIKVKEIADALQVDSSLISKIEAGVRMPTQGHLLQWAPLVNLNIDATIQLWIATNIINQFGYSETVIQAMKVAEQAIVYHSKSVSIPSKLQNILKQIDEAKDMLNELRHKNHPSVYHALETEYTYQSNKIEGNTLSLQETEMVVNHGLTISGKTMREHLEALNHSEAIAYIKEMAKNTSPLSEYKLKEIHNLVLRGIDSAHAGIYRNVQVTISGSKHMPPAPFLVAKEMEQFFEWYSMFQPTLHPVVLAAEVHFRVVTIHPFLDGNGRTSRLLMNLILLQYGYVIANIKGDSRTKLAYYKALEKSRLNASNSSDFVYFVAKTELASLQKIIKIIQ